MMVRVKFHSGRAEAIPKSGDDARPRSHEWVEDGLAGLCDHTEDVSPQADGFSEGVTEHPSCVARRAREDRRHGDGVQHG